MLERFKAPQKLEVYRSSSFLKNLCVGIGMSIMSMMPQKSSAQDIPEHWREFDEFFANYPCTWSDPIPLNNELDNDLTNLNVTSGRGMSGGALCAGTNVLLDGPHFPAFLDTCDWPEFFSGNVYNYPADTTSFKFSPGIGVENYVIARTSEGLDTFVRNFEGDLVLLVDYWNCSTSGYLNVEPRDCLLVQGNEFIYDAYDNKLLILGGTIGSGGRMFSIEWEKVQAAHNSLTGESIPDDVVDLVGVTRTEIAEAAMITPHHIIYLTRNGVPGMFNRTTTGWLDDSNPISWEMFQVLNEARMIYWDHNYHGVMDLIGRDNETFVRMSCGDISTIYDDAPSFEEAHADDLPACPESQERNASFNCELNCPENQVANDDNECVDLCLVEQACNTGEIGECDMPAPNENCLGECVEGFERFEGTCVVECEFPDDRNNLGFCVETCQNELACNIGSIEICEFPPIGEDCFGDCLEGFESFEDLCLEPCLENQLRDMLGECQDLCVDAMACNTGLIGECEMPDPNENCEGECLDGFERVAQECLQECDDNQMRYGDDECRDVPLDMTTDQDAQIPVEMDEGLAEDSQMAVEVDMTPAEEIDMHADEDMRMAADQMAEMTDLDASALETDSGIKDLNDTQKSAGSGNKDKGCQSTPNSNSGWLGLGLMALARVWRRRKTLG